MNRIQEKQGQIVPSLSMAWQIKWARVAYVCAEFFILQGQELSNFGHEEVILAGMKACIAALKGMLT
jgi:hypothetical protein